MKIQIQWDNDEQNIVRYHFERGWGWSDLHAALDEAGELISTVSHPVNVIMDISSASIIPKGALSQINRAYGNPKPPNLGVTIIVTPNTFLNAMVSMAKKIWGENPTWELVFAKNMQEAYATIEARVPVEKPVGAEKITVTATDALDTESVTEEKALNGE